MLKSIVLVSNDVVLWRWCESELKDSCSLMCVHAKDCLGFVDSGAAIDSVLLDYFCDEELEVLSLFRLLCHERHCRVVLLLYQQPNLLSHVQQLFGRVCCLNAYTESQKLLAVLNGEPSYHIQHRQSPCLLERPTSIMERFYDMLAKAAATDENVLLLGESGSGKTWTAKEIHRLSKRSSSRFVEINAAEFNENLIESNLFGTTSGAYTGAVDQQGLFSVADGGTLFFDEIAELPLSLQAKLLGVLESHSYRKLGSARLHHFEAKLIFATNKNLEDCIRQGSFRSDLYFRINALSLQVPPLRQHPEDIASIAMQIVREKSKRLSSGAMRKLHEYSWPGNIRELQATVRRACVFSSSDLIGAEDIQFSCFGMRDRRLF